MRHSRPRERALDAMEFFQADTLPESNKERKELGLPEIDQFIYAIEGCNDCYKSESILEDAYKRGLSPELIQRVVADSGTTCLVTLDRGAAIEYLTRCFFHGNTDISLYDFHRPDSSLLYITWTDMPV